MAAEDVTVLVVGGEDAINYSFLYVLIREEEGGILVFVYKEQETKNHLLSSGPWCFNYSMILLADYDDVRNLAEVSLNSMEVWVALRGLRIAMRNDWVIGNTRAILTVELALYYENCHGICRGCGLCDHGINKCDEALVVAPLGGTVSEDAEALVAVDMVGERLVGHATILSKMSSTDGAAGWALTSQLSIPPKSSA
ncbi:hypothetical protein ACLB2K_013328 [Fragaria x ananassa]